MKRIFSGSKEPQVEFSKAPEAGLSPELAPIVTLLSAQAYRRYHEGMLMLLTDLSSDGKPGDRTWREVYGVLTGTQLAVWDAKSLAQSTPDQLEKATSKPQYINFTDSSFKACEKLSTGSEGDVNYVIVVSTTLKNRHLLRCKDAESFQKWHAALRLVVFENISLQEGYTAALLSARGSRLSDIRVVLAETKFQHEDWVSVRFGSGMPWKRCFAVVEPGSKSRKKFVCGKIHFYENEKRSKKTAMASIVAVSAAYALYPQTPLLIDGSTIVKLEGSIQFKKEIPKETPIFIMPEQHSSVPGFDTLIRFIVPVFDAFGLYGRPKMLNADKSDVGSLLFGLPVLPRVHYLEVADVLPLARACSDWTVKDWRENIKSVLQKKIQYGYDGCGSSHGVDGAVFSLKPGEVSSPNLTPGTTPISESFSSERIDESDKSSGRSPERLSNKSATDFDIRKSIVSEKSSSASRKSPDFFSPDRFSAEKPSLDRVKPPSNLDDIYSQYSQMDSDDDVPIISVKTPTQENIFDPSFGGHLDSQKASRSFSPYTEFNRQLQSSLAGSNAELNKGHSKSQHLEPMSSPPKKSLQGPRPYPLERPPGDSVVDQRVVQPPVSRSFGQSPTYGQPLPPQLRFGQSENQPPMRQTGQSPLRMREPQSEQPSEQSFGGQFHNGHPQNGQPQNGQPQNGHSRIGQPRTGHPRIGQPQYGQPPYGQPQYGQPRTGQPRIGQPQYGQPQHAQHHSHGQMPSHAFGPPLNQPQSSPYGNHSGGEKSDHPYAPRHPYAGQNKQSVNPNFQHNPYGSSGTTPPKTRMDEPNYFR